MRSICSPATLEKSGSQNLGVLEKIRAQADSETVVRVLEPSDTSLLRRLVALMCRERNEYESFETPAPERFDAALWLRQGHLLALAALHEGDLVGGLAAYEFHPLGHERGEFHVAQLVVCAGPRRREVAAQLIHALRRVARDRGMARILLHMDLLHLPAIASLLPLTERRDYLQFEIPVLQRAD